MKECWFDICAAFQCNSAATKHHLTKTGDRQMFVRDAQECENAVSHSVFIISVLTCQGFFNGLTKKMTWLTHKVSRPEVESL